MIEAAKAARGGQPVAGARPRTCLVVDDSRVIRKVARSIVESLGYHTLEAENGEEALARCRAEMPNLVLTDWQMPIMSGIEFVTQLRALPGGASAKVVFCTSKSSANDIHDGISAGADDYIIKPFDELMLSTKLERIGAS